MGSRVRKTDPTAAVSYIRHSTLDQRESPEVQRQAIATWASANGVTIVAECIDAGVSGALETAARPGLVSALAELRERGAGILVAQRRDRIARDATEAGIIDRTVARLGGRVVAVDSPDDGGIGGLVMRRTLDMLAEVERALIAARTKAALAAMRQRGVVTNHRSLGTTVRNGKVRAHPKEVAALARARVLRERWGKPWRTIASMLDAEHPRRGGKWHARSLHRALGRVAPGACGHTADLRSQKVAA